MRRTTAIIGAGISGLSCAYHLKKDFILFEREDAAGGLCRSISCGGFTFDYTGHFLHLHTDYGRKFVRQVLRGNLRAVNRESRIYSNGTVTRYPFQANLYGLPAPVIRECIEGYLRAYFGNQGAGGRDRSFRDLVLGTFGRGFSKHFFIPYNSKLFAVPLDKVTSDWISPFMPRPDPGDVIRGAVTDSSKAFGYNASFLYPERGGIGALCERLVRGVKNIRLGTPVTAVDAKRRCLEAGGEQVPYDRLVSTMPLPELIPLIQDAPPSVAKAARLLAWNSVLCLNLGLKNPVRSGMHWTYFPEKKFNFYRVGAYSNIAPSSVPAGRGSLYVEIACRRGVRVDYQEEFRKAIDGLARCGIISGKEQVLTANILFMPYGYVLFDRNRAPALRKISAFLGKHGIHTIGRYGAWEYSYMEESILQGRKAAALARS